VAPSPPKRGELSPALTEIADRAHVAGIKVWMVRYSDESVCLQLDFPGERLRREVRISESDAPWWASTDFGAWDFLDDYDAVFERSSGCLMAALEHRSEVFGLRKTEIPGLTPIPADDPDLVELGGNGPRSPLKDPLRLRVDHPAVDGVSMILQRPPPVALRLVCQTYVNSWAFVVTGVAPDRRDDAVHLLLEASTALFVDLDTLYGMTFRLKRNFFLDRDHDKHDAESRASTVPLFPSRAYDEKAASLYLYATSLEQAPVLEYLAFYQVLEFFMPRYAWSRSVRKLSDMLADPCFNRDDEAALGRVAETLGRISRSVNKERAQLTATVETCVEPAVLKQYFDTHPLGAAALARADRIIDVRPLDTGGTAMPLVEQVADRIYSLRCRIVHGKDGGNGQGEPLRPFGRESKLLGPDLALIRFVAQRTLITSSDPASWER
jgi:hypothetical protein